MKVLEDRILRDGRVFPGNVLSVDSFLNHQLDMELYQKIAEEFFRRFQGIKVDKILTIEASGIGLACVTALQFHVPVVFAKKAKTSNIDPNFYVSEVTSYAHKCTNQVIVSQKYLCAGEHILIIDDFLANGSAVRCMLDLIKQAKAIPAGIGIVLEKGFQPGGAKLRADGYKLESLAIIDEMNSDNGKIVFRNQNGHLEQMNQE